MSETGRGKKRRRFGPFVYDVYVDAKGAKSRRLLVWSRLLLGLNDREKAHGRKPERGRHVHFYLPGGWELKVYLNGRWPIVTVKKTRAAKRQERKHRYRGS